MEWLDDTQALAWEHANSMSDEVGLFYEVVEQDNGTLVRIADADEGVGCRAIHAAVGQEHHAMAITHEALRRLIGVEMADAFAASGFWAIATGDMTFFNQLEDQLKVMLQAVADRAPTG